jgi:hypothetical protein
VRVGPPDGPLQSPAARHLEPLREALLARCEAGPGDLVLLVADAMPLAATVLGRLRVALAGRLGLIPADAFRLLWVVDFPLFEWSEEEKRWDAMHHPFTRPGRGRRDRAGGPRPARQRLRPGPERPEIAGLDPSIAPSSSASSSGDRRVEPAPSSASRGPLYGALMAASPRPRPAGRHPAGVIDPRGHRIPEDPEGHLPAHDAPTPVSEPQLGELASPCSPPESERPEMLPKAT